MAMKQAPVVYEVFVCELAYSGEKGRQYSRFVGKKARARALAFAQQEILERGTTSIVCVQVLRMRRDQPHNRSIAAELLSFRNPAPHLPVARDDRSVWGLTSVVEYPGEQSL